MGGQITYLNFLTNFELPVLFRTPVDRDRMLPAGGQKTVADGIAADGHHLGLGEQAPAQHRGSLLAPGPEELAVQPKPKTGRGKQGHCEHKPAVTAHVGVAVGGR